MENYEHAFLDLTPFKSDIMALVTLATVMRC